MYAIRFLACMSIIGLCSIAHAGKVILPDSCGAYEDNFDIDTIAATGKPPAIPDGKAQLVLVFKWQDKLAPIGGPKIRFGADGKWLGAAVKNSYFFATVDPGTHHICNSIQGDKKSVYEKEVTVEAGKTYYYELAAKPQPIEYKTFSQRIDYELVSVDAEMGTYFVKSLKVAQFKLKSKDDSHE